ncbi:MAG TPA: Lrp/AsnC ligand binding domain-containing protein [Nitrosopumilaceae archaeon]|nr:Lrp/AsnC ligand binding domain-containing protein [Nitrosopumilaceae archaeon]
MLAYILATCVPGREKDVIAKIKVLSEVVEVNGVMGKYDVFVKISADNAMKIDSAISKVRNTPHVTSTFTMPAIYGQGGSIDEEK